MMLRIYSLFDTKTRMFNWPFYSVNDDDCRRRCTSLLRMENKYSEFPEDYRIVRLGTFDDSSGIIKKTDAVPICDLSELIKEAMEIEDKKCQGHQQ